MKLGEVEVQVPPGPAGEQSAVVTFTYDIDGILHVSAQSSGGDFWERLILNPNLHLTEEGKEQAMERIRQIPLAAQGGQRDQLLLERALRLYTQTIGQGREMAAGLIGYWKNLMDCSDRIQRRWDYDRIKERLDMLEAAVEADPLEGGVWFGEPEEDEGFSLPGPDKIPALEDEKEAKDPGWNLQEVEEEDPNPFEGGEAITKFLELYTGKQRKNPAVWMNYVTSEAFLDAAWDSRFTALLLRKVREVQADFLPNRECMTWLIGSYA